MTPLPEPEPAGPGEESSWDYPRPPRIVPVERSLEVYLGGRCIAWTERGYRILERAHPPVYLFHPDDVDWRMLKWSADDPVLDEHLGLAWYLDAMVLTPAGGVAAPTCGYAFTEPFPAYEAIRGHIVFYAGAMDRCRVGGVDAAPQPGGFYGGWITPDVKGPFKGWAGSEDW